VLIHITKNTVSWSWECLGPNLWITDYLLRVGPLFGSDMKNCSIKVIRPRRAEWALLSRGRRCTVSRAWIKRRCAPPFVFVCNLWPLEFPYRSNESFLVIQAVASRGWRTGKVEKYLFDSRGAARRRSQPPSLCAYSPRGRWGERRVSVLLLFSAPLLKIIRCP